MKSVGLKSLILGGLGATGCLNSPLSSTLKIPPPWLGQLSGREPAVRRYRRSWYPLSLLGGCAAGTQEGREPPGALTDRRRESHTRVPAGEGRGAREGSAQKCPEGKARGHWSREPAPGGAGGTPRTDSWKSRFLLQSSQAPRALLPSITWRHHIEPSRSQQRSEQVRARAAPNGAFP